VNPQMVADQHRPGPHRGTGLWTAPDNLVSGGQPSCQLGSRKRPRQQVTATGRLSLTKKRSWELRLGITVETTENRESGSQLSKLCCAGSALGPCHNGRARAWAVTNGRARAWAVTNGHPRFGGTAGRRPFGSSNWDNAGGRFRLWSRRSPIQVSPSRPPRPMGAGRLVQSGLDAAARVTRAEAATAAGGVADPVVVVAGGARACPCGV
jgi:hypothetical protein